MSDSDSTIRLRPPPAPPPRRPDWRTIALVLAACAALGGGGALWWLASHPVPPPPGGIAIPAVPPPLPETQRPVPVPPPPDPMLPAALPRPPVTVVATPRRSWREILAQQVEQPTLVRLAENPRIFVGDFPTLAAQAAALNRVAALIEKAHAPRDRVLTEEELVRHFAATGTAPEEYYFGHNYRGSDLARFFALLARQGLPRRPEEARIEAWLAEMRRQEPEGEVALITIPRAGPGVDAAAREAILRHEIAHGFYFVDPVFAGYVRRTWAERFTQAERDAFRRFLAAEGYDVAIEDVVVNEMLAYLLFTDDPRFFAPRMVGLDAETIERLRALLRPGVPEALAPLMVPPPAAAALPAGR